MKRLAADRLAAMLAQKFHYVPPVSVKMTIGGHKANHVPELPRADGFYLNGIIATGNSKLLQRFGDLGSGNTVVFVPFRRFLDIYGRSQPVKRRARGWTVDQRKFSGIGGTFVFNAQIY